MNERYLEILTKEATLSIIQHKGIKDCKVENGRFTFSFSVNYGNVDLSLIEKIKKLSKEDNALLNEKIGVELMYVAGLGIKEEKTKKTIKEGIAKKWK